MRLSLTLFFYFLISISLSSCVTSPTSSLSTSALPPLFTTENILKVHKGMSSKKILALFGEPNNFDASTCGGLFGSKRWSCTTWEYGKYANGYAKFVFSGEHNSLKLNNFKIDRN